MRPLPPGYDPRYEPALQIVEVEVTVPEHEVENDFWKNNANVPVSEIVNEATKKPSKNAPN